MKIITIKAEEENSMELLEAELKALSIAPEEIEEAMTKIKELLKK